MHDDEIVEGVACAGNLQTDNSQPSLKDVSKSEEIF